MAVVVLVSMIVGESELVKAGVLMLMRVGGEMAQLIKIRSRLGGAASAVLAHTFGPRGRVAGMMVSLSGQAPPVKRRVPIWRNRVAQA
jgi:hypothetical protein